MAHDRIAMAFISVAMALIATSCRGLKEVAVATNEGDSTHTAIRYEVRTVPDTILVPIPAQMMQRETRDTMSVLRTDYAESTAMVSGGILHHTLANIERNMPIPTTKTTEQKDSIIYQFEWRNREIPVYIEKELTRWESLKIELGGLALGALGVMGILAVIYGLKKFLP